MRLGYSRESWYVFRVPGKMMFGRTSNVGLDPFSRYSGVLPWAAVRPDRGRSVGCGRPHLGLSYGGKVLGLAAAGQCWLRLAVGGLWLAAVASGCCGLPLAGRGRPGRVRTGHWLAAAGCCLALAGQG